MGAPLLEPLLKIEIQPEHPVLLAQRHRRPVPAQRPLHAYHLRVGRGHVGDVGERDVGRHLLLQRETGLRIVLHAADGGVDAQAAQAEKTSKPLDRQKSIRRTIDRRKSQTEFIPNEKADLDLFVKIRLDKGAEFDEYEAANAISKLTYCEVTGCQRSGDEYRITVKTPFGATVRSVGIPTQRDITLYRRTGRRNCSTGWSPR